MQGIPKVQRTHGHAVSTYSARKTVGKGHVDSTRVNYGMTTRHLEIPGEILKQFFWPSFHADVVLFCKFR